LIQSGLLYPYFQSVHVCQCPGNKTDQCRSISINNHMNGLASTLGPPGGTLFTKMNQIRQPANLFVNIDEDANTVNDGLFSVNDQAIIEIRSGSATVSIVDWPAMYHGGNGQISFADGHAEIHNWKKQNLISCPYSPGQGVGLTALTKATGRDAAEYLAKVSTVPLDTGHW